MICTIHPLWCKRLLIRSGKVLAIQDTLWRSPLSDADNNTSIEVWVYIDCVTRTRPALDTKLNEIQIATKQDTVVQGIIHFTLTGWTHEKEW